MSASILDTIKKMVGPEVDSTFDDELIVHINAALSTLAQVGACDKSAAITGPSETWSSIFHGSIKAAKARTYIYYKVRLGFDPPASSFAIENMKKLADEELWRINHEADYEDEDDDI